MSSDPIAGQPVQKLYLNECRSRPVHFVMAVKAILLFPSKGQTMTIFQIVGISAGICILAVAGTLLLPGKIHIERQAILNATVEQIVSLAASNTGYQRFNPFRTADPDLKIKPFGPSTGIGSGFHFDGKGGKGSQTVAAVTSNAVRFQIDLGAMGQPTQTIATKPTEKGLLVTWSMDANLGLNPVRRIFGLFMDRMIGDTLEQGLVNLKSAT